MSTRLPVPHGAKRPTMALQSVTMTSPGEEVRRARQARGWDIQTLAREAGLSARTISRIEADQLSPGATSVARAQYILGIGDRPAIPDEGPPLRQATIREILEEIARRDEEKNRLLDHYRIRSGELPPGILDQPGTIAGPRKNNPGHPISSDGS